MNQIQLDMKKKILASIALLHTKMPSGFKLIRKPKALLDKEVWFCVVHNNDSSDKKEVFKRLLNGKEIQTYLWGKPRLTYAELGHGKYLGKFRNFVSRTKTTFYQYVLYDIDSTYYGHKPALTERTWCSVHENWIELGAWAHKFDKKLTERVIFT